VKQYSGLNSDGNLFAVWGVDAPVPGLALVQVGQPCKCGAEFFGVMHVRSGSGLFFSHSPENFGQSVWDTLREADWTRSAIEIERDRVALQAAMDAFGLVPDAFVGEPTPVAGDVPGYEACEMT
jgi:hypothetical protein